MGWGPGDMGEGLGWALMELSMPEWIYSNGITTQNVPIILIFQRLIINNEHFSEFKMQCSLCFKRFKRDKN